MIRNMFLILISGLLITGLFGGNPLCAGETGGQDALQNTKTLIELLKARGNISEEEAEAFKKLFLTPKAPIKTTPQREKANITPRQAPEPEPARATVAEIPADNVDIRSEILRVEEKLAQLTDALKQQEEVSGRERKMLKKQIKAERSRKDFKSSWADRIRFGGDIRLRYQGEYFDHKRNVPVNDPMDPTKFLSTNTDRHRFRYRTRVNLTTKLVDGEDKKIGDIEAGIRLSTGNDKNPVSTNDTLGDYQNKDNFLLDRAYLKWTYLPGATFWGMKPAITLTGGRMPNPWFYTDLLWDHDLNFEGVALTIESDRRPSSSWRNFLTLGAFPIQEAQLSNRDKWLYGAQLGTEYRIPDRFKTTLGVAYYDYHKMEGIKRDPTQGEGETDFSAALFQQKGNTLMDIDPTDEIKLALAADYDLLNMTLKSDFEAFSPIHLILWADWVMNVGFDKTQVIFNTGKTDLKEDTMGYLVGAQVGYPRISTLGDWKSYIYYRYLESDAVLDAFTDSDFHGGGTNARGWIFGCEVGLYDNIWLVLKLQSADEIHGDRLATDLLQLDLNARF